MSSLPNQRSSNVSSLPKRTKMQLNINNNTSDENPSTSSSSVAASPIDSSNNNNNTTTGDNAAKSASTSGAAVPITSRDPSIFRSTSFKEYPSNQASLITSRRGNISFFENTFYNEDGNVEVENSSNNEQTGENQQQQQHQQYSAVHTAGVNPSYRRSTSDNDILASSQPNNNNNVGSNSFSAMPQRQRLMNNNNNTASSPNNNNDHQYLVLTKGRRTYIQRLDGGNRNNQQQENYASGSITSLPPPTAQAEGQQQQDDTDEYNKPQEQDISLPRVRSMNEDNTDLLLENQNADPNVSGATTQRQVSGGTVPTFNTTSSRITSRTNTIDPSRGEVLEITHSADEPIPNLSFFSIGDGYFLPRPEAVVPSRRKPGDSSTSEDDDDDEDENEDNNNNNKYSNPSSRGASIRNLNQIQDGTSNIQSAIGSESDEPPPPPNNASFASNTSSHKKLSQQSAYENLKEIFSGSKNVSRMFLYNLLDGACFGLWQASVMPAFMYMVGGNSNSFVGYNAAVQGSCQMFSALVAAYVADKRIWPKHYLLRLASLIGCIAIAITVLAVNTETEYYFWPSSALWGIYIGFANPSSESIFADSVPGGQRVTVYTYKWILQLLSYLAGYITTVIMFEKFGDTWEFEEMRPVLYAGLFAHVSSMISLWFLHTDYTLDIHKQDDTNNNQEQQQNNNKTNNPSKTSSAKTIASSTLSEGNNNNNNYGGVHSINARTSEIVSSSNNNNNKVTSLTSNTIHSNNLKSCSNCGQLKMIRGKITSFKSTVSNRSHQSNKVQNENEEEKKESVATREEEIQQQQQQKDEDGLQTCDCVLTEKDKEIIEELEDDAKREKTGDPLLVDICPTFCCGKSSSSTNKESRIDDEEHDDQQDQCCLMRTCCSCCEEDYDRNERGITTEKTSLLARNDNNDALLTRTTNPTVTDPNSLSSVCAKMTLVPILIVTGDIMQAIGGGVTVRFFPLFFKNALAVTPVELAIVSIILCIFAAVLSHFLKKFSANFKRTTLIVIIRFLGSGLMFLLEFAEGKIGTKFPMLSYFVLRSALLNSMMGLSRSIIMDFCRKRHRTFFSAMESLSTLSFSGSAAIGGVLADKHGYRSTFGVTAGFYVLSALLVAPAGVWVDQQLDKEKEKKKEKEQKDK